MNQPGDSNGWPAWIVCGAAVGTALWHIGAKVFSYVTRTELAAITDAQNKQFVAAMAEQRAEILRLHGENGKVNSAIFDRLGSQDKAIARIEGALSGRYKTLDPNAR